MKTLQNAYLCESYDLSLHLLPKAEFLQPVYDLASEPHVSRYMEWQTHTTLEDTKAFFKFCEQDHLTGQGLHFGVQHKTDMKLLGVGSLISFSPRISKAEVTTWLGKAHWGSGWNRKIKHVLFELAFFHLNLNKLSFRVAVDNVASNISHKKLHTRLEGVLRQEMPVSGKLLDVNYYGLLKSEYIEKYSRLKIL